MRHNPPFLPSERVGVVLPRTPLLIGLACLLLGAGLATLARQQLDHPVVLWLNRFATRSALLDNVAHALTSLDLLQSAALVAGIWLVWFDAPEPLARARVMAGVFAASLAALVSRGLELALPMHHPRPLVDAALPFVLPLKVDPAMWKDWSSFPSDTAALLFGLAMVITLIRPRIGFIAFAWALVVCSARVYEGLHYPTDILAGAGLGVAVVCILQHQAIHRFCFPVAQWADRRAGIFYAGAFIASYAVADTFEDILAIGRGLAAMFRHS
jgi:undecaprenyl-diphosphatase